VIYFNKKYQYSEGRDAGRVRLLKIELFQFCQINVSIRNEGLKLIGSAYVPDVSLLKCHHAEFRRSLRNKEGRDLSLGQMQKSLDTFHTPPPCAGSQLTELDFKLPS